jgi:hypothetical protein
LFVEEEGEFVYDDVDARLELGIASEPVGISNQSREVTVLHG